MGIFGKDRPAEPCVANGHELKCLICGHDKFFEKKAQLNTATATFLGWDFVNPEGICAICEECGYIHWFMEKFT